MNKKIVSNEVMAALTEFAKNIGTPAIHPSDAGLLIGASRLAHDSLKNYVVALPAPKSDWISMAEQCRGMGIQVGDVIEGRKITNVANNYWQETKLKLLWLGEKVAVWIEWTRSDVKSEWQFNGERANIALDNRQWVKVNESPYDSHGPTTNPDAPVDNSGHVWTGLKPREEV